MGISDHPTHLWGNLYAGQEAIVRTGMEQRTGSKLGKEDIKAVHRQLAYLNYMQRTTCKMPDWMEHKRQSRLQGEIPITSDMQMTPHIWQKRKGY